MKIFVYISHCLFTSHFYRVRCVCGSYPTIHFYVIDIFGIRYSLWHPLNGLVQLCSKNRVLIKIIFFFLFNPITQINKIRVIKLKEGSIDGAPAAFARGLISLTSIVTLNLTDWLSLKVEKMRGESRTNYGRASDKRERT